MKTWNNKIGKETKWSGDESTLGFPVSGDKVEEFIKESLQKKIGYLHLNDNNLLGFADIEDYEEYVNDPTKTDLIIQLFSIYNYTAYANKDILGNIIDFSLTESEGKEYLGICTLFSDEIPTDPSKYKWTYIKGAPGRDGINGTNGLNGVNGIDGVTPTINPINKHWMFGNTDSGIIAEGLNGLDGVDGKDGKDGKDGVDGQNGSNGSDGITPHINPLNNHWMIGDIDTGILAEGVNGKDGIDGTNGRDGIDGKDGRNGVDGQNAPYEVITYGKSAYASASITGPLDVEEWYETAPQKTVGTFIWKKIESYSGAGVLQNTSYIRMTGDPGSSGQSGKWYEYAGVWNGTAITNSSNIGYYVKYGSNFYMNIAPDNVSNNTIPGTDNTKWELMSNTRQYYIGKAFFGDYAEFGSAIINGDWMISKLGTVNGIEVDNEYSAFDPLHPNESIETTYTENGESYVSYNFIPKYALNMRTGKVYLNDAELRGSINASGGNIGGWEIGGSGLSAKSAYQYIDLCPGYDRWVEGYIEAGLDYTSQGHNKEGVRLSPSKLYTYESSGQDQTPPTVTNQLNTDGSGSLGRGGISWDSQGNFTVSLNLVNSIFEVLASGYTTVHPDPDESTHITGVGFKIADGKIFLNQTENGRNSIRNTISLGQIKIFEGNPSMSYSQSSLTSSELHLGEFSNLEDENENSEIRILSATDILDGNIITTGNVTANSFIKTGGTSSQVLMADGSTKTGYTGNVNLGTHTLVIEGGIITNVTQNNS